MNIFCGWTYYGLNGEPEKIFPIFLFRIFDIIKLFFQREMNVIGWSCGQLLLVMMKVDKSRFIGGGGCCWWWCWGGSINRDLPFFSSSFFNYFIFIINYLTFFIFFKSLITHVACQVGLTKSKLVFCKRG